MNKTSTNNMAKYGEPSPIPEPIKAGKTAKFHPKTILVVIPILVCFLYAVNSQNIDSRQRPRPATSGNQAPLTPTAGSKQ